MKTKLSLNVLIVSVLLILFPVTLVSAQFIQPDGVINTSDACSAVYNTPTFTFSYGDISIDGSLAPIGSLVEVKSPRGDLVGCAVVTTTGKYGSMTIYGEDTTISPSVPGMRTGERVTFYVNHNLATSSSNLTWSDDKDLHLINLSATSNVPFAAFSASSSTGTAPLQIQFTDNSTGLISAWYWTFGDGQTSSNQNPQHIYLNAGTYTVTLSISGPGGTDADSRQVNVYSPVTARFTADQTTGTAPLTVHFTNQSTGDWSNLQWNFGDQSGTSSETNPIHTYMNPGIYFVSLTASGLGGSNTVTVPGYITVNEPAPIVDFSATPTSGIAPFQVTFSNQTQGAFSGCIWNFGDGTSPSTQCSPNHTYNSKGVYQVSLSINYSGGTVNKVKQNFITVYAPPVVDFSVDKSTGAVPLTVKFVNKSSGDWSTAQWDFGDSSPLSEELNPTHVYLVPGVYSVTLSVSGPGGNASKTKTAYITVRNSSAIYLPFIIR